MENTLSNALLLMLVGMISVTLVLSIVVVGGSLLINIVNKFYKPIAAQINKIPESVKSIDENVLVVIASVVAHITNGKGQVEEVTKDL